MKGKLWRILGTPLLALLLAAGLGVGLAGQATAAPAQPITITNLYNGRCLDADANRIGDNGTPTQLWDDLGDGQRNQHWGGIA
ncbi:RICIN domain-containing protein [Actinophytocola sp.]|uniref:RICIN domain-containing protein n=1 Tax=Actinophytocola sp. TaxID=1872138 RepID=UPI00389A6FD4